MLTAFSVRDVVSSQEYLSCGKYAGIYATSILTSNTLATTAVQPRQYHQTRRFFHSSFCKLSFKSKNGSFLSFPLLWPVFRLNLFHHNIILQESNKQREPATTIPVVAFSSPNDLKLKKASLPLRKFCRNSPRL